MKSPTRASSVKDPQAFEVLNNWSKSTKEKNNYIRLGLLEKLPTTVDNLYLWMIKSKPNVTIVFDDILEGFDLKLSHTNNAIFFVLNVRMVSLMSENSEYTHSKKVVYLNNDANFLERAKKVTFQAYTRDYYGEGEETLNVYKELSNRVDTSLAAQYTKSDIKYSQKAQHEKNVEIFRDKLRTLHDFFPLEAKVIEGVRPNFNPPAFLDGDAEDSFDFLVSLVYGALTENDERALLVNRKSKREAIREHLEPFVNLTTYVINIRKIEFEFLIKGGYADGERLFITINISCELIKPELYYETIGYYKTALDNICNKGFKISDLSALAEGLGISIEGLRKDEACNILNQHVNNLSYKDFQ